ncbi:hypothetical protein [Kineosporia sp. R_H_3]|uniref:hypothetical protein n=1 Tax=Kineosporia sp. R_H_3 TaxID=1961848 RepID=UPI000B4A6D5E|nr:hypothetical protein [Kineosporia sp. R_H_3]
MTTADELTLTPTQNLVMEVLAARWREGWSVWTFEARHRRTLEQLAALGLVHEKSGVVEKTWLGWLTDEGKAAVLSPTYQPPSPGDLWSRPDLALVQDAINVARGGWHQARRWEEPLPLPTWVEDLRAALGDGAECTCRQCTDSPRREQHYSGGRR